ncbi:uncharacterized protein [Asterias amurensis]|uniref:uncharacterized protein isoform X2 n=1 Tax=Asterias amurensis TaxID=7602 RepID=UPI003AB59E53
MKCVLSNTRHLLGTTCFKLTATLLKQILNTLGANERGIMGGSASACLRKSRRGKYRVNEPHGPVGRNGVFATFSDFGVKDDAFYLGYRRNFEDDTQVIREDIDSQQKELMKEVFADVSGETEKNLRREDGHIHELMPQGVDEVDTNHPDLPQGVTCVTCAATMMEIDQSKNKTAQEKDESGAAGTDEQNEDAKGATPDGSESSENKEKSDGDENQPGLGKGSTEENSASGDKLSRGTRRRRYKALSNVPPALLRNDVY